MSADKLIYCIDIGNTRTHCATVRAGAEGCRVLESDDYQSYGFADFFEKSGLLEKSGADCVSWCSVVPHYASELEVVLNGVDSMRLTGENSPIFLDVKEPAQVGHDRIADAVGAGTFFKPPYIVVDMGTAVTIDLVDKSGNYAGGAIAPGMHAFTDYLSERAAQLPKINPSEADFELSVGKNTVEAMYVGCAKGFCKLADGIIADIERDFFGGESATPKTVFTGGSISLLPKNWLAGRRVEYNLAQIGLAHSFITNRNKP